MRIDANNKDSDNINSDSISKIIENTLITKHTQTEIWREQGHKSQVI